MDASVSDLDEGFDHGIGLSSPHCSEIDEPASPQPSPDYPNNSSSQSAATSQITLEKSNKLENPTKAKNSAVKCNVEENSESNNSTKENLMAKSKLCRSLSLHNCDSSCRSDWSQLQRLVCEMKDGFVTAMHTLAQIQYGDQMLEEKVENNKLQYDNQLADVLKVVENLKGDLNNVLSQLQTAIGAQQSLQTKVDCLQYERDILLQELEKAGVIPNHVRKKYQTGKDVLKHSTSLTTLLEKSSAVSLSQPLDTTKSLQTLPSSDYRSPANRPMCDNSNQVISDRDSGVNFHGDSCDDSPMSTAAPTVSPIVQSYIANLAQNPVPEEDDNTSQCSITLAANHSLDLSRSLIDELDDYENEENETQEEKKDFDRTIEAEEVLFNKPSNATDTPKKIPPHERTAKEANRLRAARELLETEKKYCSSLWTLLDHFAGQLKEKSIIPLSDISEMFPQCLGTMYEYHCSLYQTLEQRLMNCKYQYVLGDILFRFFQDSKCELLKQYQIYMRVFPHAMQSVKETAKTNVNFRKFLKECQSDPYCEGLDLGSFMLTPIQRVPRYVLLLKHISKFTDVEHPDYYYLETSLQHLGSFLTKLNNSIETSLKEVNDHRSKPKRRFSILPSSFRLSSTSSVGSNSGDVTVYDKSGFLSHSVSNVNGSVRPYQETIYGNKSYSTRYNGENNDSYIKEPKKVKNKRYKKDSSNSKKAVTGRSNSVDHSRHLLMNTSQSQNTFENSFLVPSDSSIRVKPSFYNRTKSLTEELLPNAFQNSTNKNDLFTNRRENDTDLMNREVKKLKQHMYKVSNDDNKSVQGNLYFHELPVEFCSDTTSTPNVRSLKSHSAVTFGVYGDDSDAEADISSSTHTASIASPNNFQQRGSMVIVPANEHFKFQSKSCLDFNDSKVNNGQEEDTIISQDQINIAFNHSLEKSNNLLNEELPEHWSATSSELEDPYSSKNEEIKLAMKSLSEQDWRMVTDSVRGPINRAQITKSNTISVHEMPRKSYKKKGDQSKIIHSRSTADLNESCVKKKTSLKQSIKNIFFRKRSRKTVDENECLRKRVPLTQSLNSTVLSQPVNNTGHKVNIPTEYSLIQDDSADQEAFNFSQIEENSSPLFSPQNRFNVSLPAHLEISKKEKAKLWTNGLKISRVNAIEKVCEVESEDENPCSAV